MILLNGQVIIFSLIFAALQLATRCRPMNEFVKKYWITKKGKQYMYIKSTKSWYFDFDTTSLDYCWQNELMLESSILYIYNKAPLPTQQGLIGASLI